MIILSYVGKTSRESKHITDLLHSKIVFTFAVTSVFKGGPGAGKKFAETRYILPALFFLPS